MTSETVLRQTLCEFAHLMHRQGLVAGLDGNVSARLSADHYLASPTQAHLGVMRAQDLVVVRLDGTVIGEGRVTSEWPMHAACYRARPDIHSVFHAHPVHVVARSLDGMGLDTAVLPEVLIAVGPIHSIPYKTTGTQSLADAVAAAITQCDAVILRRHGAVAVGPSAQVACARIEAMEHASRILAATTHPPSELDEAEQARLAAIRRTMSAP